MRELTQHVASTNWDPLDRHPPNTLPPAARILTLAPPPPLHANASTARPPPLHQLSPHFRSLLSHSFLPLLSPSTRSHELPWSSSSSLSSLSSSSLLLLVMVLQPMTTTHTVQPPLILHDVASSQPTTPKPLSLNTSIHQYKPRERERCHEMDESSISEETTCTHSVYMPGELSRVVVCVHYNTIHIHEYRWDEREIFVCDGGSAARETFAS